ncbi:Aste57867_8359 [Aphanomyces stellatus]|uniref:Aste57867_8359 protein n=1 Tax=Aphanomyces stellatus TaxID=120398 RepID=A0A485KK31_9STRA|nr:hypothetical protein As57867_008327 [Aphanomyces stellatus]VFT85245.1 Aste57867_8359 [Aphanomyces stellatus]
MLSRMTRRIFRVGRPVVVTNVEFGEEETAVLRPRLFAPSTSAPPSPVRLEVSLGGVADPFLRLNLIRKQLQNVFRDLDVPSPIFEPPSSEASSPASSHQDCGLVSLLQELPPLPPNEFQQEYTFDRNAHEGIPIERYFTLGQHLYQSMVWTTHPVAWHAAGQSCRAH